MILSQHVNGGFSREVYGVIEERRLVNWSPKQLGLFQCIDRHVEAIYSRNKHLISQHMKRVGHQTGRLRVLYGGSLDECLCSAEQGEVHDFGKNHSECQAWMRSYWGVEATELAKETFRRLHCSLGPQMLHQLDAADIRSSHEELSCVCLHHHDPYTSLNGLPLDLVPLVAVADAFDNMTVPEEEHCHTQKRSPEEAIAVLFRESRSGRFDPFAVKTLSLLLGM
jgi:response regulator RpfG family c-di-GMP phosphodiesterase